MSTAAGCLAGQVLSSWVIETLLGSEMTNRVLETVQPVGKGLNIF
ncbi:thiamine biosynthesis protein ThiJ [Cohnella endophytica]|uniref:Thiamine biosynthesis protein ThiJ n=1 Tax=Cohnella endophytica TaxID=2419778 RepID=A0A494X8D2_9BACL|nr:thiamine biosynthesis protein ThiJ [Cohnella endophytica]